MAEKSIANQVFDVMKKHPYGVTIKEVATRAPHLREDQVEKGIQNLHRKGAIKPDVEGSKGSIPKVYFVSDDANPNFRARNKAVAENQEGAMNLDSLQEHREPAPPHQETPIEFLERMESHGVWLAFKEDGGIRMGGDGVPSSIVMEARANQERLAQAFREREGCPAPEQQELLGDKDASNDQIAVAGVSIPVDEHGRVSLNALHRASGAGERKEPNKWLRGQQAKELIEELSPPTNLSAGHHPINTVNGGGSPSTYAHPDLAISYAGWISPRFQLQVNRTFRQYQESALPAQPDSAPQPELPRYETTRSLDLYLELAQFLGLEPELAKQAAARLTEEETGAKVTDLLNHAQQIEPSQPAKDADQWMTPTTLGWLVGMSAMEINRLLAEAGLQYKPEKDGRGWRPTVEADGLYVWDSFTRTNSQQTDYRLLWHKDVLLDLGLKAA